MRFKKVFSNLELEEQGHGIIMRVTRLLLLGPFYTIQTSTFLHTTVPRLAHPDIPIKEKSSPFFYLF